MAKKKKKGGAFDPTPYTTAPVLSITTGPSLCAALASKCPKDAPKLTRKSAKRLGETARVAKAAFAARQKALGKPQDKTAFLIDVEADAIWGGMLERARAYARLPEKSYPKVARANAVV